MEFVQQAVGFLALDYSLYLVFEIEQVERNISLEICRYNAGTDFH